MRSPSVTLQLRCISVLLLAVGMATAAPRAIATPGVLFGPHIDYATGEYPSAVAIGDLNGDGNRDLVTANYLPHTVSVLLGTGLGVFGANTDYATGGPAFPVAIGDLNGDGKPDLAVGNYDANTVSVLLGNGDGTFGANTDFGTGGTPYAIGIADLNADGKPDVVTANDQSDNVSVLLGNGDGTLGAHTEFGTGSAPSGLAIGDLNGDGKPDLATPNSIVYDGPTGNTVSVLLGNGDGTFGANTNFATGSNPLSVAIGDLNEDGNPDLVAANQVSDAVSVLLGDGTGSFGAKTDYATGRDPISVAIGDVDADGHLDLATANSSGNTVSVLLGDGAGSLGVKTDYATGESPVFLAMGDLNGDGKLDLATANQGANTVSVLLNISGPVPTLLARFEAVVTSDGVELRWEFGEPHRVAAVTLERSGNAVGPWLPLTLETQRSVGRATVALDQTVTPGETYYYRLTANLTDGTRATFGPISAAALLAVKRDGLTGIAPNPAFGSVKIDFTLVREDKVRISVIDVVGREAAVLANGPMSPGSYSMLWDGSQPRLPAGVYFVRWQSSASQETRTLVLRP